MKFATSKEHRDFFYKQGIIEFADLLTPNQLNAFNNAIDQTLAERLHVPVERLKHLSAEQIFMHGHDLWRTNDELHKWACQPKWAEIVAELTETRPIRLAYDQLFPYSSISIVAKERIYASFMQQQARLNEISCIKPLVCGLIIALSPSSETEIKVSENSEALNIFPSRPGNAIFFKSDVLLNLNALKNYTAQRFYLITYADSSARYLYEPKDPHTHTLKHLGYIQYNTLTDRLNPVLCR